MRNEFEQYKKYKTMQKLLEQKMDRTYPVCKFIRVQPMDSDRRIRDESMRYLRLLCIKEER